MTQDGEIYGTDLQEEGVREIRSWGTFSALHLYQDSPYVAFDIPLRSFSKVRHNVQVFDQMRQVK